MTATFTLRVVDNDRDEITVMDGEKEIRGWSYADDTERRVKMLCAHEYMEGRYVGITPALDCFEAGSANFDNQYKALASIAISLKRIADAMHETNAYGEGPAAAIGGNIARALSESWRP